MTASEKIPTATKDRTKTRYLVRRVLLGLGLFLAAAYTVYPIVASAFDAMGFNLAALFVNNNVIMIGDLPFHQGVFRFTPIHYLDALSLGAFPARVVNSLIIGALSVAAAIAVGVPASYVLARVDIKGRSAFSFILLALRTVSPFAVVVPLYLVFTRIGLWDTFPGISLAELLLVLTVVVWMVKGFFEDIPKPVYDAASVFGASEGQIFLKVALPIAITGIVIAAIFGFVLVWNEYLIASILTGPVTKPVSIGIFSGMGALNKSPDFVDLEAASTLAFIPVAVVMLAIRKYLAKGFSLATAR